MQLTRFSLLAPLVLLTAAQVCAQNTERAKLTASDGTTSDRFGVSLTTAGNTVIVGAPNADLPGAPDAGAVYVFERSGATWTETAKLTAATPNANALFGTDLDFDGTTLFVGAPRQESSATDDNGITFLLDKGAVSVFERTSATWTEIETLEQNLVSSQGFGTSLAVKGDRAAVTYRVEQIVPNVTTYNVAFFRRQNGVWSPAGGDVSGVALGSRVELEDDLLVVTVSSFYVGAFLDVFERSANSFAFVQSIPPPPQFPGSLTGGFRLGLIRNRDTILALGRSANAEFQLVEYRRSGGGLFIQQPISSIQGVTQPPLFPSGIALAENDLWLGIGAASAPAPANAGEILQVTETAGVWAESDRNVASDAVQNQLLGWEVDASDSFVAASTFGGVDDAVYVFDVDGHQEFCFGDGSSPPGCGVCPCGNDAPIATVGGCVNSSQRSARLLALGRSSLTSDSLQMELFGAKESSFAVLLSGNNALPQNGPCPVGSGIDIVGAPFDGLRCVGGQLVRHGLRSTDAQGNAASIASPGWGGEFQPATGLLSQSNSPIGTTRHFQVVYRDLPGTGCGTGLNTTNAVSVQIRP